jgi:tetratricopeptide (TPR) repeat protein
VPGFKQKIAFMIAFVAMLGVATPPESQGLAGAYLAGNQANRDNNYDQAARFYAEALARDPNNPYLLQNVLLAFVGKGDVDRAVAIATKVASSQFGSQLADLVLTADAIKAGNFSKAQAILKGGEDRFSPLMLGLLTGWIALGDGKMTAAVDQFDSMQNPTALRLFGQYHKALALASVGDFEGADRILKGDKNGSLRLNRGSLIAHAQIMSQLDRKDDAIELLDDSLRGMSDQGVTILRDSIKANGIVDYDYVNYAHHGAAEVFLTLARVLEREQDVRYALIYARLAEYLRPDRAEAILLTAEILQEQKQYDLAAKSYAKVKQDNPMFFNAELGRADALVDANKLDAAIEVLRGLIRSHGHVPRVHMSLGDVLRGQENYADATEAYNAAVSMIPTPTPGNWFLFYARGITHEREGNWDLAEADFRNALKLNPDQPLVLNYLGYSLVEFGMKLPEAQAMIERAVKSRPNDGYITDSLGWVLYRLGKFEEAVGPMERAVQLVSSDPIINDHLGDVYWMVGRKREAEFQWSRALSFKPEENEADRIRSKLDLGLDAVLENEKRLK